MIRRTFFQLLSGAFFPRPIWNSAAHFAEVLPPNSVAKASAALPIIDPEWLRAWMRLPRLPLLPEDYSVIPDLNERNLVVLLVVSIGLGEPIQFEYFGGTEPGRGRRVLPVLLFTTSLGETTCGVGTLNPIYLLGWCETRRAARTFRLDRMKIVNTGGE